MLMTPYKLANWPRLMAKRHVPAADGCDESFSDSRGHLVLLYDYIDASHSHRRSESGKSKQTSSPPEVVGGFSGSGAGS